MTLEKTLRGNVMQILRDAKLDPMAVENVVAVGCPDIECIAGWIELKAHDLWPKSSDSPLKLRHDLSKEQRIWLRRRVRAGGRAYVLLQVGSDYILMNGDVAAEQLGKATPNDFLLRDICVGRCYGLAELRTQLPQWLSNPATTTL